MQKCGVYIYIYIQILTVRVPLPCERVTKLTLDGRV